MASLMRGFRRQFFRNFKENIFRTHNRPPSISILFARLQLFSNPSARKLMRGEPGFYNRGQDAQQFEAACSRVSCPGGVAFENRSASGGWGAVLVANSTRPVIDGVSVLVVGI